MHRRLPLPLLVAGALALGGLATPAGAVSAAAPADGPPAALQAGSTPETRPFPDNAFSVADPAQKTGRRIALPTAGCPAIGPSRCNELALINTLDGFDVRPRVTLPFTAAVDLRTITADTVRIEGPGGFRTGLVQLVLDPITGTVAGQPADYLAPGTTYTLVVDEGIRTALGGVVAPCPPGACPAGDTARRTAFTTLSSTAVLDQVRAALDEGSAYTAAGIAEADRTLRFDTADDGQPSIFPADGLTTTITTRSQTNADGTLDPAQPVPNTAQSYATYGVGSLTSPQYLQAGNTIAPGPTGRAPEPTGNARLSVTMLAPAKKVGTCMKPVIFGHGFTGSNLNVFLAADTLGTSDLAIFATDVVGHGFGPNSTYTVTPDGGAPRSGKLFGRGVDLDGNGTITNTEGAAALGANSVVGSRDALIQTVVDNMALVRALRRGVDVDGDGTVDTCTGEDDAVGYYGQSFGGIYGTMLLGTDPDVQSGVPNVPGGPITEITRLGGFRPLLAQNLATNVPALRNGPPGLYGFTESMPLRRDPQVVEPQQGAVPIQQELVRNSWVQRSGSPEAYAPALAPGARFADKRVIVQVAYGDATVPNPTAAELLRAGKLYDRTWVYRNDRTANAANNPHGFLLNPTLPAHAEGQEQIRRFLAGEDAVDPDTAAGETWEPATPRDDATPPSTDYRVQLDCLHFPDPQTGAPPTPTPATAVDCTDRSNQLTAPLPPARDRYVPLPAPTRVVDTRRGLGAPRGKAEGRLRVDLAGLVPDAGASAVVLNVTALSAERAGHLVVLPAGAPDPGTSNVNVRAARPGRIDAVANEAIVKLSQDRAVDVRLVGTRTDVLVDVVGYLTPNAPTGGRITPLVGQRVLDTRTTTTPLRQGAFELDLGGTVASGASSVLLNVTATLPQGSGHLSVYPSQTARPATSNVNVERGQTQANEVLVQVGADGKVVLYASVETAIVVDVLGRVDPPSAAAGADYRALDVPQRVLDTRRGLGGPTGRVRGVLDLDLSQSVPDGATAVVLNVTALGATRPALVSVFPTSQAPPRSSNVNLVPGSVQANEVLSPLGGDKVSLRVGGADAPATFLVADVVGYLTAPVG